MTTDEGSPLSRAAIAAIGAAGVALVLAIVTVVVVLGRSPPDAAAPPAGRVLLEVEADAAAVRGLLHESAVTLAPAGLLPRDPVVLGLQPGDVLTSIGGRPLQKVSDLQLIMRAAIRGGATALLFEIDRGGRPAVVRVAVRGDLKTASDPPDPPPSALSIDPDHQALLDGIIKIDDEHVEVTRDVLEKVVADPMTMARGARVMPSSKNGVPNGFKFYAVRPSSVYAKLGVQNGDTLHSINGYDLSSIDRALEVYQHLRTADTLVCALTRRGQPVTITITIR